MSIDHDFGGAARSLLDREEVEGVLSGAFYRPQPAARPATARAKALADKPAHYKVICISMYTQDLAELDAMVDALKAKGITKANRSALIRHALASVDLDRVPKGL
jgi:hypothetical protein